MNRRPYSLIDRLLGRTIGWWTILGAVICWELITRAVADPFFPPPTKIVARLRELWLSGPADRLWLTDAALDNIPPSVARLLGGWGLAVVLGIAIGLALGRVRRLAELFEPTLHFTRAIPPTALAPVWLVLLDAGTRTQIVTITFGVIWPILLNTIDGARSVEPLQHDTTRVYRLTRLQRAHYLFVPSALPKIFTGVRLSLGLAVILMVVSEMTGSANGIAFSLLLDAQRNYDTPAMWAGILVLGALGYALSALMSLIERRALAHHQPAHQMDQRSMQPITEMTHA